jgi:HEAT repeat protein
MKPKIILCLVLILSGLLPGCSTTSGHAGNGTGSSTSSTNDWQTKAIASEADLDRVIAQLQIPATRFDAMLTLLDFAGYPKGNIYSTDMKVNALHDKAIQAMRTCPGLDAVVATMIAGLKEPNKRLPMIEALLKLSGGGRGMQLSSESTPWSELMDKASQAALEALDVPTIQKALVSPDWLLRLTAVKQFGAVDEMGHPTAAISAWEPLVPQMEKLAADDDESIRSAADESLRGVPGTEKFLAERETNETSPNVIMTLLNGRFVGQDYQTRFQNRFLTLFVPLLSNRDEMVREGALHFVANNHMSAPMYHIPFGMDVLDRVLASTKAKSAKERWEATLALKEVRELDPDRSRDAFLDLVNDPDKDVRTWVAAGLANQLEREDVKQAIATLVKDKSPTVRYFTILAAGPPKFIPELEELSKGPNAQIAEWAAQMLKQVAFEKRNLTLQTILTNIESSIPELALVKTFGGSDYVEGVYIPANQRPLALDPRKQGDLLITIRCYDSKEAAERGLSASLSRQAGPDQTETFQGLTVYRWSSETVTCRAGLYVVDICAYKPSAKPLLLRAMEGLVRELGASVKN